MFDETPPSPLSVGEVDCEHPDDESTALYAAGNGGRGAVLAIPEWWSAGLHREATVADRGNCSHTPGLVRPNSCQPRDCDTGSSMLWNV
jgi:hypothetical protein